LAFFPKTCLLFPSNEVKTKIFDDDGYDFGNNNSNNNNNNNNTWTMFMVLSS